MSGFKLGEAYYGLNIFFLSISLCVDLASIILSTYWIIGR